MLRRAYNLTGWGFKQLVTCQLLWKKSQTASLVCSTWELAVCNIATRGGYSTIHFFTYPSYVSIVHSDWFLQRPYWEYLLPTNKLFFCLTTETLQYPPTYHTVQICFSNILNCVCCCPYHTHLIGHRVTIISRNFINLCSKSLTMSMNTF